MNSITQVASELREKMQDAYKEHTAIGTLLQEVQQQLPYSEFEVWVRKEFRFTPCTARRFISQAHGGYVRALPNQGK